MELVSIIMPNFNSSFFIQEAIDSVLKQSYKNWELIICDDGSKDESINIAKSYELNHDQILVIPNKFEKGASGARNSCLEVCNGRYIAFLDSDDIWKEDKLMLQITFMRNYGYAFTYSYHEVIDEVGNLIGEYTAPSYVDLGRMKFSNFIPCLTAVYDSKILGKIKQPVIKKRNDYALWLSILKMSDCKRAYCLKISCAKYRSNSYGLSSNKIDSLKFFRSCLINYAEVGKFLSFFYATAYLILILIKKKFRPVYNFFIKRL